jgi:hypothetical protein
MKNSPTLAKIENFARQELLLLLDQCTPEQQMTFKRMYAHLDTSVTTDQAVANMPYEKVNWAIQQVEQTLLNNKVILKEANK